MEQAVLPKLFCKPTCNSVLYQQYFGERLIEFRSLDLNKDIELIHQWVHSDHALPFWQLNMTIGELFTLYSSILQSPSSHSFIGCLDGKPVCQTDVYLVAIDEVSKYLDLQLNDCGMHFIMAPAEKRVAGLSYQMMKAFLFYFFSNDAAERMYGEPDADNIKANRLVIRTGFQFLKQIQMSYKKANLYVLTKERFQQQYCDTCPRGG